MQTKQNIMNTLIDICTKDAQLKLNEYKDSARKEEDGTTGFYSTVEVDNKLVSYECMVTVPLWKEYQSDVDDFRFIEPEDVLVEDMVIECIEPLN